jgi:hypothetical protein
MEMDHEVVRKPLHPCGPLSRVRPHHHLPSTLSSRHGADRNHHHVQGKRCVAQGPSAPKSAACTTHHTIVSVRPRRYCSFWLQEEDGGGGGVHIIHPRPKSYE